MKTREELEFEKLKLEVAEKRWPALRRMTGIAALIGALIGAGGFFIDSRLAQLENAQIEQEIAEKRAILEDIESELDAAEAALDEMTEVAAAKEAKLEEAAASVEEFTQSVENARQVPPQLKREAQVLREKMTRPTAVDGDRYRTLLDERASRDSAESGAAPVDPALRELRRDLPVESIRKILQEQRPTLRIDRRLHSPEETR